MKVQPTPTSPKARVLDEASNRQPEPLLRAEDKHPGGQDLRPRSLSAVVFSVLIGLCAGALGGSLVQCSFFVNTPGQIVNTNVVQKPNTTNTSSTNSIISTFSGTQKTLLSLFERQKSSGQLSGLYTNENQKGTAFLVTDDGWAVTISSVLEMNKLYVAVTSDRKVLAISSLHRDPSSALILFRIDGLHYSPAQFLGTDLIPTSRLYGLAATGSDLRLRAQTTSIAEVNETSGGILRSSDVFSATLRCDTTFPIAYEGAPLVNDIGKVVGVLEPSKDGATSVVPIRTLTTMLASFLRDGAIHRPSFGVHYIDLATTAGVPEKQRPGVNVGALIAGTPEVPAFDAVSPAKKAGLKSGDIIIKVGSKPLSETAGLAESIVDLSPGATVDVEYMRAGENHVVSVKLGDIVETQ